MSIYLAIFAKRLHLACLTEFLIRLWSLCDIIYFMLWLFLENNSLTKVMTSIVSATLPGVETLITNPPFYGD